jgi:molybdate transport repressor ModE-like protein
MALPLDFSISWLGADRLAPDRAATLLRLLGGVGRSGSLAQAARDIGVSYRHAWGLFGEAQSVFGLPVVDMRRGRGAQLTALGEKLLWADALVRSTLEPHLTQLRHELEAGLAKALPQRARRLTVCASHDLALAELPQLCAGKVDVDLAFRGSDECLAALASGKCDIAGFHVADALPRAAAAAAALGKWLDPKKHALIHFITREQGLIASPDTHIRGVNDLTRAGVRFINRSGSARDDSVAAAVADGRADAGFGLKADANRYRLDFVPLAVERYFLAFERTCVRTPAFQALVEVLGGREFARRVARLPGYDAAKAGAPADLDAALNWVRKRPASRAAA